MLMLLKNKIKYYIYFCYIIKFKKFKYKCIFFFTSNLNMIQDLFYNLPSYKLYLIIKNY